MISSKTEMFPFVYLILLWMSGLNSSNNFSKIRNKEIDRKHCSSMKPKVHSQLQSVWPALKSNNYRMTSLQYFNEWVDVCYLIMNYTYQSLRFILWLLSVLWEVFQWVCWNFKIQVKYTIFTDLNEILFEISRWWLKAKGYGWLVNRFYVNTYNIFY